MGCQISHLNEANGESEANSQDTYELNFKHFIQQCRGEVLELYHFFKILHRGPGSIVRRAMERKTRKTRICKIIPLGQSHWLGSLQEVQILRNLSHPNIVQIIEYFLERSFLYIILEQIPGKSLHEYTCTEDLLSLEEVFQIVQQILVALKYCHAQGIAHNSLHEGNVLLMSHPNSEGFVVKLIGFSGSTHLQVPKLSKNYPQFREKIFRPPEGLMKQVDKKDIWAVGVILLDLLTGGDDYTDFLAQREQFIKDTVQSLEVEPELREQIHDLLSSLLAEEADARLSAEEALQHPVFLCLTDKLQRVLSSNSKNLMNKLMKFKIESNLKSLFSLYATLNFMSVHEKTAHLSEFYNLDKNKDGKIDFDELIEGLKDIYDIGQEEAKGKAETIFENNGKDKSQYLGYFEYALATVDLSKQISDLKIRNMFNQIDVNHNGILTNEEILNVTTGIDNFNFMKDFNGKISYEQFRAMMYELFSQTKTT